MQTVAPAPYGREAGFIVGETSPLEFTFVSSRDLLPPRLEYLVVPGVEERGAPSIAGERTERVDVLAQVVEVGIDSAILSGIASEQSLAVRWGVDSQPVECATPGAARYVTRRL